jgi:hypothetical protein
VTAKTPLKLGFHKVIVSVTRYRRSTISEHVFRFFVVMANSADRSVQILSLQKKQVRKTAILTGESFLKSTFRPCPKLAQISGIKKIEKMDMARPQAKSRRRRSN